jgi:uncharacterized protein DUF5615
MVSLLADENFSHRILRGIRLCIKNVDLVVAQGTGLCGERDPALLTWAAQQGRIVLTHDRQTMPKHAYDRVRAHQPMPGIIVVSDEMRVGDAIELLTMYIECGTAKDFENSVTYIP